MLAWALVPMMHTRVRFRKYGTRAAWCARAGGGGAAGQLVEGEGELLLVYLAVVQHHEEVHAALQEEPQHLQQQHEEKTREEKRRRAQGLKCSSARRRGDKEVRACVMSPTIVPRVRSRQEQVRDPGRGGSSLQRSKIKVRDSLKYNKART